MEIEKLKNDKNISFDDLISKVQDEQEKKNEQKKKNEQDKASLVSKENNIKNSTIEVKKEEETIMTQSGEPPSILTSIMCIVMAIALASIPTLLSMLENTLMAGSNGDIKSIIDANSSFINFIFMSSYILGIAYGIKGIIKIKEWNEYYN